ncbi:hypothetical protein TD95_000524 [Thielaviopsis punctulata]|uniref:Protein-tyrosine-phosphatase n=1 Tax=Thielaviopsis punctulata TaxID=72032 RepID=A0A0F4Z906_9PEZI|nr:hypothetical protein TD95_000524 [Thielaviopsis punctulata]
MTEKEKGSKLDPSPPCRIPSPVRLKAKSRFSLINSTRLPPVAPPILAAALPAASASTPTLTPTSASPSSWSKAVTLPPNSHLPVPTSAVSSHSRSSSASSRSSLQPPHSASSTSSPLSQLSSQQSVQQQKSLHRLPSAFRGLSIRSPMKRARSPAPPPISTGAALRNPSINAVAVAAPLTSLPVDSNAGLSSYDHHVSDNTPFSTTIIGAPAPRKSSFSGFGGFSSNKKHSSKGSIGRHAGRVVKNTAAPTSGYAISDAAAMRNHLRTPSPKGAKMPPYLATSLHDIQAKFTELTWIERSRVAFGSKRKGHAWSPPRPSTASAAERSINPNRHMRRPSFRHPDPQQGLDRYINIQPWTHNRMILDVPPNTQSYVNASPVSLISPNDPERLPEQRYIAMQGPTETSTPYVWRMISEQIQGEGVIVQLTNMVENFTEKCFQYFPPNAENAVMHLNEKDIWGDGWRASLRFESIKTFAEGAIEVRKLVLNTYTVQPSPHSSAEGVFGGRLSKSSSKSSSKASSKNSSAKSSPLHSPNDLSPISGINSLSHIPAIDNPSLSLSSQALSTAETPVVVGGSDSKEIVIWHLFYTRWPDFGVPAYEDLGSFLQIMELSRQYNTNPVNPRIVHCSAGVGRTGTFIALEHLKRELDAGFMLSDGTDGANGSGAHPAAVQEELSPTTPGGVDTRGDMVFGTVDALREQRKLMVQSPAQYVFLYQVLRKLWYDRYGMSEADVAERAAKRLEGNEDERPAREGSKMAEQRQNQAAAASAAASVEAVEPAPAKTDEGKGLEE